MFEKSKKRKQLKRLKDFFDRIQSMPSDYKIHHNERLNCIVWLMAYYDGRAASTPKEYLEDLLIPVRKDSANHIETIKFLYHWVYYNEITGF